MFHIETKQLIEGAKDHGVWKAVQPGFDSAQAACEWADHVAKQTHDLDVRVVDGNGDVIENTRIAG